MIMNNGIRKTKLEYIYMYLYIYKNHYEIHTLDQWFTTYGP